MHHFHLLNWLISNDLTKWSFVASVDCRRSCSDQDSGSFAGSGYFGGVLKCSGPISHQVMSFFPKFLLFSLRYNCTSVTITEMIVGMRDTVVACTC